MSETSKEQDTKNNAALSSGNLVALVFLMAIAFGLLGFILTSTGLKVGGTTGKWVGLSSAYILMCLICLFVHRKFIHPNLKTVCVIFVLMGAAKVGEEIGKDVGTDFATTWGKWIGFVAVFAILFLGGKALGKKDHNQIEQSPE